MAAAASADTVERRFGEVIAVDRVTFQVEGGEIVGLLGANGAGKTTLIRMLLGLLPPSGGTVSVFGTAPGPGTRHRLGYMPQGSGLYDDLTVAENLEFAAGAFGVTRPTPGALASIEQMLVGELSLGMRKRVGFAAATIHVPDLLVLDEPTSGVGPLARAELWESIHAAADAGAAVLVSTHYMDEAEQCDRLIMLAAGREVASGTSLDIVGDLVTLEIEVSEPATALDRLDRAGIAVLPAGHRLRIPGGDERSTRRALSGLELRLTRRPASLEEAFVVLSSTEDRS